MVDSKVTRIIDSRHPSFVANQTDWEQWRLTFQGGNAFRDRYLRQFNVREDRGDFELRRAVTPIPTFAKAAVKDVRNSIFQRMRDITRVGGSRYYNQAVAGEGLGVDRRSNSMAAFLGQNVLTELLTMSRCGIYVDNSAISGGTLADVGEATPYLYLYQIEDILSWTCASPDNPSEFQAVLLRDTCVDYDRRSFLTQQTFKRFRLLWLDPDTGKVMLQFYDDKGNMIDRDGLPTTGPYRLDLTRIPFIMPDIGDSLLRDASSYQIALLNLTSRDVWYAMQSNTVVYVEQRDLRSIGSHLKQAANEDGSSSSGGQGASDNDITVGTFHGRAYGQGMNQPGYIHPSSEPLKASMALQEKYEANVRQLINLAVQNLASSGSSAAAKQMDNAGLESGLSFIGLVLESTERLIAQHWAAYENRNPSEQQVATVKYPDRYSLKTDADRIKEANELGKLMFSVPGRKAKQEIAKQIVSTLLGGHVSVGTIESIHKEIDNCDYLTSDPNTIIQAVEAGLCSDQTGSQALGFSEEEYLLAREDHALRAQRIAEAQTAMSPGPSAPQGSKQADHSLQNPAARGVTDLAVDPAASKAERKQAADTTLNPSKKPPVRGKGRKVNNP